MIEATYPVVRTALGVLALIYVVLFYGLAEVLWASFVPEYEYRHPALASASVIVSIVLAVVVVATLVGYLAVALGVPVP